MVQPLLDDPGTSTPAARRTQPHDEDPLMPPPEDTVGWRLAAMEKRQDSFDAGLAALRQEISAGFAALRTDIKEQRLVTKDLYDSEQAAQNDRIDSAVKLAMWALGLVCSLVIAALLGLLVRLATA